MAKEKVKDKGGTLGGLSKSYNNNRSLNGKVKNSHSTSSKNPDNLSHKE
ncbi:MAG: hypothetical protein N4A63_09255 [Vallitalea sp.]|jgi:hypothetical protein|nr:hypothetical protein [Vallitalea sp.]